MEKRSLLSVIITATPVQISTHKFVLNANKVSSFQTENAENVHKTVEPVTKTIPVSV